MYMTSGPIRCPRSEPREEKTAFVILTFSKNKTKTKTLIKTNTNPNTKTKTKSMIKTKTIGCPPSEPRREKTAFVILTSSARVTSVRYQNHHAHTIHALCIHIDWTMDCNYGVL